jgi:hypothetical protein
MIEIHINPVGVEKVLLVSGSDMQQDFDLAAWQAIRQFVDKIDRKLRKLADNATEET